MAIFEVTVDSEGRIILPREIAARVGARPCDRLGGVEIRSPAAAVSEALSIHPVSPHLTVRIAARKADIAPRGGLDALKAIAPRAWAEGVERGASADPIGAHLLEEDPRSRGL